MESGIDTKAFLGRILIGAVTGQSPQEFAEQEVRRMRCGWCAIGWPLEDGQHVLPGGLTVPCGAEQERD
jgi:hypothetical protein